MAYDYFQLVKIGQQAESSLYPSIMSSDGDFRRAPADGQDDYVTECRAIVQLTGLPIGEERNHHRWAYNAPSRLTLTADRLITVQQDFEFPEGNWAGPLKRRGLRRRPEGNALVGQVPFSAIQRVVYSHRDEARHPPASLTGELHVHYRGQQADYILFLMGVPEQRRAAEELAGRCAARRGSAAPPQWEHPGFGSGYWQSDRPTAENSGTCTLAEPTALADA